jgi:hypothetical protein
MTLEPNRPAEKVEVFKFYEGRNIKRMPDLIKDGRVPMNFAQIMRRRLDVLNTATTEDDVRNTWWLNYQDSGDGARRSPDGKLKVAYNSASLRTITPKSKLSSGALILTPEQYAAGDGPEFTKEQVDTYTGHRHGSVEQVMENPIYVDGLAHGDKALAREYAKAAFTLGKQRFQYDEVLGIYATGVQETPVERLWFAGALDVIIIRAGADGVIILDNDVGRLVGVAPEAPVARDGAPLDVRVAAMDRGEPMIRTPKGIYVLASPDLQL